MTLCKYHKIPCGNILVKAEDMLGKLPLEAWQVNYPPLPGNRIRLAMNCLFLEKGDRKILIDPGMTEGYHHDDAYEIEYEKPVSAHLAQFTIHPENITEVILTHLHFDHCAGIFQYKNNVPCAPAFPAAKLYIGQEQYDNITMPAPSEKDAFISDFITHAKNFYPIILVKGHDGLLVQDIYYRKYQGHTPGMIVPFIPMGQSILVYTTDLVPLSIPAKMGIVSAYDLDWEKSREELSEFLIEAEKKKYELFLFHEPGENIYQHAS